ncbi:MAG TPA: hypothetical protein VGI85_11155 [Chthoniobacterales bacterium]|jgi:hypothetical protein
MNFHRRNVFVTFCFGVTWVVAVAVGWRFVLNYDSAAGAVGTVPQKWPAHSAIHRASDRMTLVMLAHPRCPCTRATMGELARIMASAQGKVNAYVLFFRPKNSKPDWDNTDLRRSAAAIPGVTAISDVEGVEAHLFGAETSGHTLLFGRDGSLLFSGGITDSRGHAGGNKGESAIVALVNNQRPALNRTMVFGCRIADQMKTMKDAICSK